MAADVEAKAEQIRLQLSSMDLNSNQTLPTISEERDVFYDDDGLVLGNVGFDSVVFVDNLPLLVGEAEVQKLESDVREIFGAVGVIKKDGFSMPVNPRTLETLGHCYIEFTTRQEAELAMENIDGHKYEKSVLSVTLYDELNRVVDISPQQTTLQFESQIAEKEDDDGTESTQSEDEDEDKDDGKDYSETYFSSEEEMESRGE